jgi:hypothetical protein
MRMFVYNRLPCVSSGATAALARHASGAARPLDVVAAATSKEMPK